MPYHPHSSNVAEIDAAKLHTESLQLRNQQFYLGTLALAGSGVAAWIAPGLSAVTEKTITQTALVTASLTWLLLLLLLYCWSLALRHIIAAISVYLEITGLSYWEPRFRRCSTSGKAIRSHQTEYVAVAFSIYGLVAVAGSIVAAHCEGKPINPSVGQHADSIELKPGGIALLLACYGIYVFTIWRMRLASSRRDPKVKYEWLFELGLAEKLRLTTGNMGPKIKKNSGLVIDLSAYRHLKPARQDIVAFDDPSSGGSRRISRVVAIPGDRIELIRGTLNISGNSGKPPLKFPAPEASAVNTDPYVIAADHYYLIDDSKEDSRDSITLGPIDLEQIVGKAHLDPYEPRGGR